MDTTFSHLMTSKVGDAGVPAGEKQKRGSCAKGTKGSWRELPTIVTRGSFAGAARSERAAPRPIRNGATAKQSTIAVTPSAALRKVGRESLAVATAANIATIPA